VSTCVLFSRNVPSCFKQKNDLWAVIFSVSFWSLTTFSNCFFVKTKCKTKEVCSWGLLSLQFHSLNIHGKTTWFLSCRCLDYDQFRSWSWAIPNSLNTPNYLSSRYCSMYCYIDWNSFELTWADYTDKIPTTTLEVVAFWLVEVRDDASLIFFFTVTDSPLTVEN